MATGGCHGDAAVFGLQIKGQFALRCCIGPHHQRIVVLFFLQRMGLGHPGLSQSERRFGLVHIGFVGQIELLACGLPQRAGCREIFGCLLLGLGHQCIACLKVVLIIGVAVLGHGQIVAIAQKLRALPGSCPSGGV